MCIYQHQTLWPGAVFFTHPGHQWQTPAQNGSNTLQIIRTPLILQELPSAFRYLLLSCSLKYFCFLPGFCCVEIFFLSAVNIMCPVLSKKAGFRTWLKNFPRRILVGKILICWENKIISQKTPELGIIWSLFFCN